MESKVKEKPIIFSSEMVKAILSGKKTQTRRVVKKDVEKLNIFTEINNQGYSCFTPENHWGVRGYFIDGNGDKRFGESSIRNPYGKIGDRLWLRESFLADPPDDGSWCFYEYSDGVLHNYNAIPKRFQNPHHVLYKATYKHQDLCWKSSIHMPRWASRINLEITNIRVERIQDISAADALAEGISQTSFWKPKDVDENPKFIHEWKAPFWDDYYFWNHYPQIAYQNAWDAINAKRGYTWELNCFVWVLEFKQV